MHRRVVIGLTISAMFAGQVWAADPPIFVDQGANWTPTTRADFYTRDQGSRMIPLAWLRELKQANGQPFLATALAVTVIYRIRPTPTDCRSDLRFPDQPDPASLA